MFIAPTQKIRTAALALLLVALVAPAWLSSAACGFTRTPSDAVMESNFRQHREEFEQLRRLMIEDSSVGILLSVSEDRTDPDAPEAFRRGLSNERLEKYRRLLRQLHLRQVGRTADYVSLQAYAGGPMLHGTYKGYLYSEDVLSIKRKAEGFGAGNCDYSIRPLQDHWYLYCD